MAYLSSSPANKSLMSSSSTELTLSQQQENECHFGSLPILPEKRPFSAFQPLPLTHQHMSHSIASSIASVSHFSHPNAHEMQMRRHDQKVHSDHNLRDHHENLHCDMDRGLHRPLVLIQDSLSSKDGCTARMHCNSNFSSDVAAVNGDISCLSNIDEHYVRSFWEGHTPNISSECATVNLSTSSLSNVESLRFASTNKDASKKSRRGRPPGSKNRSKDNYVNNRLTECCTEEVDHFENDNEPPSKKRRHRLSANKRHVTAMDGVDGAIQETSVSDELIASIKCKSKPKEVHERVAIQSAVPLEALQPVVSSVEVPKPGSVGISRFSERVVASLARYVGSKGGDLRLGCDEHGVELFIVRCQYCARDVRLSGRRTWNFTGVHIPRCIKHGFRKAGDVPSASFPTKSPQLVTSVVPDNSSSSSSSLHSSHLQQSCNNVATSCSTATSCSFSSSSSSSSSVNDAAVCEARLAVVAAAAAAASVFPSLKHSMPQNTPQAAAAAAAAFMNMQHPPSTSTANPGHSLFFPHSSMSMNHSHAVSTVAGLMPAPLGMSPAFSCLPAFANTMEHQLLPFSNEHMMAHHQQSLGYHHHHHPHHHQLPVSESLGGGTMNGLVPHMDSRLSMQHGQFGVLVGNGGGGGGVHKNLHMKDGNNEDSNHLAGVNGMNCMSMQDSVWRRLDKSIMNKQQLSSSDILAQLQNNTAIKSDLHSDNFFKLPLWNQ